MDGFEVAARIRACPRAQRTPILFLTAHYHDEADMFRGYQAGAVDYLVKPFAPEILRSKVSIFIELARSAALLQEVERRLQAREASALGDDRRRLLLAALADVELWSRAASESLAGRLDPVGADALRRLIASAHEAARLADPGAATYGRETGAGAASEDRERSCEGIGLGLAIVRELIGRHDGAVWVESREGKGSAFFFTIPFAR